jgi:hypothetical protein
MNPSSPDGNCDRLSVHMEARREADCFKWIESKHAGRDLGEEAITIWIRRHWRGFLRARLLQHLMGTCYWCELDLGDFGILRREFGPRQSLVDTITEKLRCGDENLDLIRWANHNRIPMDEMHDILVMFNINARRIDPQLVNI